MVPWNAVRATDAIQGELDFGPQHTPWQELRLLYVVLRKTEDDAEIPARE